MKYALLTVVSRLLLGACFFLPLAAQTVPAGAQAIKVETAQARDLRFEGSSPGLVERHQAALSLTVAELALATR